MSKTAIVIGGGFGGLSAACYLARDGYQVTLLEKNDQVGGRGMVMQEKGFTFDLGPSWYMMPDVFEDFFADFGKKPSNYFELTKLDPSYKVFFDAESYDVFDAPRVYELFEQIEPGSSEKLKKMLDKTGNEYEKVRKDLLEIPMTELKQAMHPSSVSMLTNPELVGTYHRRIKKYFKDSRLQQILEFMVVFMGGSPKNIPALYSLLAYVDMGLGIYYPMGGMNQLVEAFKKLAEELGVTIKTNSPVNTITTNNGVVDGVVAKGKHYGADLVVANADYHHVETTLLDQKYASVKNWQKKVTSPSALLIYLGVDTKVEKLRHHNLFFDVDWDHHFSEVFKKKKWSKDPLFYVGAPSVTDDSVAPKGHENIFVLAPMASGLKPTTKQLYKTADDIVARLSRHTGVDLPRHTVVRHVRAHEYFEESFNAYQGNAFGLAHTLRQSAIFRPPMKSKKLPNLYFVGQYTNPGTGVPLVTISGKTVAALIQKEQA